MYSYDKVVKFVHEEDVKFIRLAFFDVFGVQKNISIMPGELLRAFTDGISFDASAVAGFGDEVKSDLFLYPDPETLSILPWRPANGRVARMYCDIRYPDGTLFEKDSRLILKNAVKYAKDRGITVNFGSEVEFYLFRTDEKGDPTKQPFDYAGYMDIAPEDRGENVRREICFTLIEMGIQPEASHHEEGPGQNEIDFHYSDALTAADNTSTFKWVVKTAAMGNGLYADFSPKPIREQAGSGMHVNMSVCSDDGKDYTDEFMSGIMAHVREMTLFLNPCENSYERLGERKAPGYITWSPQNRSQLIRIPASGSGQKRIELRSPDPMANPYLAYALLIYAGMDGIEKKMPVPEPMNINLYKADPETVSGLAKLPQNFGEAYDAARNSRFIREILPDAYLDAYKKR
ncbi:MAG TPA: glutamine synthetase [Candidatus Scybalocola faecipullorum]|nr:glutamine synthetase [Candidatus Scybalocola faecipullorum]